MTTLTELLERCERAINLALNEHGVLVTEGTLDAAARAALASLPPPVAELEALRELSEAASPGPWVAGGSSGFPLHGAKTNNLLQEAFCPSHQIFADAALIAASVNLVRKMLGAAHD